MSPPATPRPKRPGRHGARAPGSPSGTMRYTIEFLNGDRLIHRKAWDFFGLDSAKQHAVGMTERYEATSARVLDDKGRAVFIHEPPAPAPRPSTRYRDWQG